MTALAQATRLQPIARACEPLADDVVVREYLTFRIGREEYGINILHVQEIRSYETPTRLAGASAPLTGVISLRGSIVPILDLRLHLGSDGSLHMGTVTIVLNLDGKVVGTVVDSVCDVVALSSKQVKPAPQLDSTIGPDQIIGIAPIDSPHGQRMLVLLDIKALMSSRSF